MTLDELERRARSRLSEEDVSYFSAQNLSDWLNEAPDAISSRMPFTIVGEWTTSTLLGVDRYVLDSDVIEPRESFIELAGGRVVKLRYIEPDAMSVFKYGRTRPINGQPTRVTYYPWSDGIVLEVDRVYQGNGRLRVKGSKRAARMILPSDLTDVPEYLTNAMIAYAVWRAKEKDEEIPQADRARSEFERECEFIRSRRAQVQADRYNRNLESWETIPGYGWPWWP